MNGKWPFYVVKTNVVDGVGHLTLFTLMNFPMHLDSIRMDLPISNIKAVTGKHF